MAEPAGIYENRSNMSFNVGHERTLLHFDGYGSLESLHYLTEEQANSAQILPLIQTEILKVALKSDEWHKIYDKLEDRYKDANDEMKEIQLSIVKVANEVAKLQGFIQAYNTNVDRYKAWKHMLEWAYNYMLGA